MSDSEQTERIAQYDSNQDTLFDSKDFPLQPKKLRSANRVYKFIESFTSSESAKEALNNPFIDNISLGVSLFKFK